MFPNLSTVSYCGWPRHFQTQHHNGSRSGNVYYGRKNHILTITSQEPDSWNFSKQMVQLKHIGDLAGISSCISRTSIDNFERPHYGRLVIAALAIPQHIATIFVFISVFIRIKEQSLAPRMLIWMVVLTFLVGYISWEVLSPPQEQRTRA